MAEAESRCAGAARALYLWACERLYAELAWAYDAVAWAVSAGRWGAWRRAALPFVQGPHVLELGFGTGALLGDLATHGLRTVGVEPSAAMQRRAARRSAAQTAQRVQAVAQALPLIAGHFNTVVATFPAPYILDAVTLREVARVLAPQGRLVVGGLWVERARGSGEIAAPAPRPLVARLEVAARRAGLCVRVESALVGNVRVGLLLAHKQGEGDADGAA